MSKRNVEEILDIFRRHDIDIEDVCKVIVYWYEPFSIFDDTPVGRLKDAAKEVLEALHHDSR